MPRTVRTACRNRTMRHVHQSTKNSSGSSAGNLKILFSILFLFLFLFFKGSPCRDGCTFVGRCCDTKNRRSRACEIRSVRNRLKRHDAGAFFFFSTVLFQTGESWCAHFTSNICDRRMECWHVKIDSRNLKNKKITKIKRFFSFLKNKIVLVPSFGFWGWNCEFASR